MNERAVMSRSLISPVALPFSMAFIFGLVMVAVPLTAIAIGASSLELGYIGFIASLSFVSFVALAGRLVGRVPAGASMTAGCVMFSVCSFGVTLCDSLAGIYLMAAGYSLGLAFYWPALESRLGAVLRLERLVKTTGYFNVSVSLGFTAGFLFSGIMFDAQPKAPFYTACILGLLLPLLLIIDRPESEENETAFEEVEILPPGAKRYLYLAWMSNSASHFALINLSNIFPKLGTELGMTGTDIGGLLFSLRLLMSVIFFALIFTKRWHFSIRFLLASQVVEIFGLLLVAVTDQMIIFSLGFMLVGAGVSVTYASSLYYGLVLSRRNGAHSPEVAGRHSGLHEFFLGLGILTGPLFGGMVARFVSLRGPYVLAIGVISTMIVAEIIYARVSRSGRDQGRGSPRTS